MGNGMITGYYSGVPNEGIQSRNALSGQELRLSS